MGLIGKYLLIARLSLEKRVLCVKEVTFVRCSQVKPGTQHVPVKDGRSREGGFGALIPNRRVLIIIDVLPDVNRKQTDVWQHESRQSRVSSPVDCCADAMSG